MIIFLYLCSHSLEDLVEKQQTELTELRQQTSSAFTSSTSGRGSLTPEGASDSASNPQVFYSPSSSGRVTALCTRGTDPFYDWPVERTSTATCNRSTSPLVFPDCSDMTSSAEYPEDLTNQKQKEKKSDTIEDHVVSTEKFV